jgi:hypothetical protein
VEPDGIEFDALRLDAGADEPEAGGVAPWAKAWPTTARARPAAMRGEAERI